MGPTDCDEFVKWMCWAGPQKGTVVQGRGGYGRVLECLVRISGSTLISPGSGYGSRGLSHAGTGGFKLT